MHEEIKEMILDDFKVKNIFSNHKKIKKIKTKKLSLEAFKEKAKTVATAELMEKIIGGTTESKCHPMRPPGV